MALDMQYGVPEENIRYAIALKGHKNRHNYVFVTRLQHSFAGKDEVLAFLDLKRALCFCTKKEASDALAAQPVWARERCEVVAFEQSAATATRYLLTERGHF